MSFFDPNDRVVVADLAKKIAGSPESGILMHIRQMWQQGKIVPRDAFSGLPPTEQKQINVDLRIPLMADSDSTFIADSIPAKSGHPALVS